MDISKIHRAYNENFAELDLDILGEKCSANFANQIKDIPCTRHTH